MPTEPDQSAPTPEEVAKRIVTLLFGAFTLADGKLEAAAARLPVVAELTRLYHAAKQDALAEDHRDSHITILKEGYAVIERLLGGDPSDSIVDRIQDLQRRVAEARTGYHAAKIAGKIEALDAAQKGPCLAGFGIGHAECIARNVRDALAALKSAQEEQE